MPWRDLLHGQPLENVAPTEKKSGCGICENHFARAKPLPFSDSRFFEIDQPGFGTGNQ